MNRALLVVLPLTVLGVLVGCEDHTEGVTAATVTEPAVAVPTPGAAEAAPSGTTTAGTTPGGTAAASGSSRTSLAIDPATSTVGFTAAKITRSHDGSFSRFEGTIELDRANLTASSVSVTIHLDSLALDPADLARHLLTDDFFDVARFPTSTFVSTSVTEGATGNIGDAPATHTIAGDMTLHGRTQRITFPAIVEVTDAGVRARSEFTIDRRDFGIVYPGMPNDLIRDQVVIRFDVRAPAS